MCTSNHSALILFYSLRMSCVKTYIVIVSGLQLKLVNTLYLDLKLTSNDHLETI